MVIKITKNSATTIKYLYMTCIEYVYVHMTSIEMRRVLGIQNKRLHRKFFYILKILNILFV